MLLESREFRSERASFCVSMSKASPSVKLVLQIKRVIFEGRNWKQLIIKSSGTEHISHLPD